MSLVDIKSDLIFWNGGNRLKRNEHQYWEKKLSTPILKDLQAIVSLDKWSWTKTNTKTSLPHITDEMQEQFVKTLKFSTRSRYFIYSNTQTIRQLPDIRIKIFTWLIPAIWKRSTIEQEKEKIVQIQNFSNGSRKVGRNGGDYF